MLGVLILAILLISVFWLYKKLVVFGFCLIFLLLGIYQHQNTILKIENSEIKNFIGQEITLFGQVVKELDVRQKSAKLFIKINSIENVSRYIDEKVLITTDKYSQYQYGDELKIKGKLESPLIFEDFNYKDYLSKDGIYAVMYFPKIQPITTKTRSPSLYGKILEIKSKLRESIYQNLSPPQSSILGAIILGDKARMSQYLKEKLNATGVRHITAVSGLHVAVLTSVLMAFLIGLGFWRGQAFYFTIIIISLFIIMTGLSASAVRASIMAGLFLLAQHFGRMNVSSRAIVFAAAIMLFFNPLLLTLDVGFQLSFLAMMGIIYLLPFFTNLLRKIPNFFQLRSILAMSLSAQVFTLPILIYNFGYVSLVSPIVNILIVPLLPFVMISGFIFALVGMIFQPLGWILSLFSWFLLTYITKIINFFSEIPFAALSLEISWVWLIISYLILGFITWRLEQSQKLKFLDY